MLLRISKLDASLARLDLVGAQARGLVDARDRSLPIVDGWVLATGAFKAAVDSLPTGHDPATLLKSISRNSWAKKAARARQRLLDAPLPEGVQAEIDEIWEEIYEQAPWGVMARTSSTCEDEGVSWMAGIDAVRIGIHSHSELEEAIKSLWAGVFFEYSLRYLRGQGLRDIAIAVVIQPMKEVEASVTLLTRGPSSAMFGDQAVCAMIAGPGLAALVADTPRDTICASLRGTLRQSSTAHKPYTITSDSRAGLARTPVPSDRATRCSVSAALIESFVQLARSYDGTPRELEILVQNEGARVAAVRRLGGLGFPRGGTASTVWSRVLLSDLLPRRPSPLAWSLITELARDDLIVVLRKLGLKAPGNLPLFRRIQGMPYLNLSSWLPSLAALPAIRHSSAVERLPPPARALLENQTTLDLQDPSLMRIGITFLRLRTRHQRLLGELEQFETKASNRVDWFEEMDLGILPDDALATTLLEVGALYRRSMANLISSAVGELEVDILERALVSRFAPEVQTSALFTLGTSATLEHVLRLSRLAETARDDSVFLDWLKGSPGDLATAPKGQALDELQRFIELDGFRGFDDQDPASPRWSERTHWLLTLLRSLVHEAPNTERLLSAARSRADRDLATLEAHLSRPHREVYARLRTQHMLLASARDRARSWLARSSQLLRQVTFEVDERLRRLDETLPQGAAFFCSMPELREAVSKARADLGPVVRSRIEHAELFASRPALPQVFWGAPLRELLPIDLGPLQGLGVSPGVAKGPVRILKEASDFERVRFGDVLVVASLSLEFCLVFPVCAAVVATEGGRLGKGALVARELGIPAVVSVAGASTLLCEGEEVRVDGTAGRIERSRS